MQLADAKTAVAHKTSALSKADAQVSHLSDQLQAAISSSTPSAASVAAAEEKARCILFVLPPPHFLLPSPHLPFDAFLLLPVLHHPSPFRSCCIRWQANLQMHVADRPCFCRWSSQVLDAKSPRWIGSSKSCQRRCEGGGKGESEDESKGRARKRAAVACGWQMAPATRVREPRSQPFVPNAA